jgi:hypothetical protein
MVSRSWVEVEGGRLQKSAKIFEHLLHQQAIYDCAPGFPEAILYAPKGCWLSSNGPLWHLLALFIDVHSLVVGLLPELSIIVVFLERNFKHFVRLVLVLIPRRMIDASPQLFHLLLDQTLVVQPREHLCIMPQFPQRCEEISPTAIRFARLPKVTLEAPHGCSGAISFELVAALLLYAFPSTASSPFASASIFPFPCRAGAT